MIHEAVVAILMNRPERDCTSLFRPCFGTLIAAAAISPRPSEPSVSSTFFIPPSRILRFAAFALPLLLLAPPPARPEAVLDVSGSVVSVAPRLEVRVVVANRGDRPAGPVDVVGELLGERSDARIAAGVAPGREGAVLLAFSLPSSVPAGTHAVTLLLQHPVDGPPDAAGNPPKTSHLAWLIVAIGASPPPAVRLAVRPLHLEAGGDLVARLESADGTAHRVRLRAVTAPGLRAEGTGVDVSVPAQGPSSADLALVRAGAPRGSRHAVLVVADVHGEPLARTAVADALVQIAEFPSRLPGLRPGVLVLAILLLAVALGFECWRHFRA